MMENIELRKKTQEEIVQQLLFDVSVLKVRFENAVEALKVLQTWMDGVNDVSSIDQTLFDQLNERVCKLEDKLILGEE